MNDQAPVRHVRLMADYFCHPLWDLDKPGDIDPAILPLSDSLKARLRAWADTYDRTLNQDYPPDSGFSNADSERKFESEGTRLWSDVTDELGPMYAVSYYSQVLGAEAARPVSHVGE